MARIARSRRKMANTSTAPRSASNLLSSTSPLLNLTTSSTSYNINFSGIANSLGVSGYSLEDLNYTELLIDSWNATEINNVTDKFNATVLPSSGYCDEWEAAQHKLFQVSQKHSLLFLFSVNKKSENIKKFHNFSEFNMNQMFFSSNRQPIFSLLLLSSCRDPSKPQSWLYAHF